MSVFLKNKIYGMMASLDGKRMGIVGVIPAAALGVPLYMCGGGTILIIYTWLDEMGMKE